MARTPSPNLNFALEILRHTQALVDGAIKVPSGLNKTLLRNARKSQSSGLLAHQYKSAVELWEKSEQARLEALVMEQSSQQEIDAAQAHWERTKQIMQNHPDFAMHRQAVRSAELDNERLSSQQEEALESFLSLWKKQSALPWYKELVSSQYVEKLITTGSPPSGLTGWLASTLGVSTLSNDIVSAKQQKSSLDPLIEQSYITLTQSRERLENAQKTHPDYVSADLSLRSSITSHAQLKTARINASSVSEHAYEAISRTLKSRWSHPDFQSLARAVSQLSQEVQEKIRERIERVYPKEMEMKEAWRSRNAGSPHSLRVSEQLTSTQSASSDPFMGTALWWMMINSNSMVFQSPLNNHPQEFLSEFARHSCIELEHSHQPPHSHASDSVWSAGASALHAPSHDYASPSPSYDHSPPPSPSYDSPSPSPNYDSPSPSYDSSSSFSSGGDF